MSYLKPWFFVLLLTAPASADVAVDPNSLGYTNVTNNGSLLTNPLTSPLNLIGNLEVGDTSRGELLISDGAMVTNEIGVIGDERFVGGTVTVTGVGSTWTNTILEVGHLGDGVLDVLNGARLVSSSAFVGQGSSSLGEVTVSGAGSVWESSGDLRVGDLGRGRMSINGGATVSNLDGLISTFDNNFFGDPVSSVTVDGNGSTWTNNGELIVSNQGDGVLSISNGGGVTSVLDTTIARFAGAIGDVVVSGGGSSLTSNQSLFIGGDNAITNGGAGSLVIENSGIVNIAGETVIVGADDALTIDGGVLVTGSFTNIAGGAFDFKNGSLQIAGGVYDGGGADLVLNGENLGDNPTLQLSNNASTANVQSLVIGTTNAGQSDINSGAQATSVSTMVGASGTLNLNGGSLTTGLLDNTNGGNFNHNSGTVTVDGGTYSPASGEVVVAGANPGDVSTFNLTGGATASITENWTIGDTNEGLTTVDGAGSSLNVGGSSKNLNIGRNGGTGTLTISNGASVTAPGNNVAFVGIDAGANGTVNVMGAGSTLDVGTVIQVGNNNLSTGTMNITNGGSVSNTGSFIGKETGSTGAVTVDGPGSTWTDTYRLRVGNAGTGTLDITNGGIVSNAGTGYVGADSGGTGTVTVDGTGSTWTNNVELFVGNMGSGTLNITDGGSVSNGGRGNIGSAANSTGTVTVDGNGSTWTNNDHLIVGDFGEGTLSITGGGVVTNVGGYIADEVDSTGTATVDGAGSTWTSSATLHVGNFGNGSLNVQNGGNVSSNVHVLIGAGANSIGSAVVDGTSSTLSAGGQLTVGNLGTGTLSVTNGGAVSNPDDGRIGDNAGSTGTATVDGVGSTWTNSNNLVVENMGTGTLNITGGGSVSNQIGFIGTYSSSNSTATVNGAGSSWTNTSLYIGRQGTGTLDIQSGGLVSGTDGYIGSYAISEGTVTVDGAGSTWTNSGFLRVGDLGTATLNITNGGSASANSLLIVASEADSSGSVTVDGPGSQLTTTSSFYLGNHDQGSLEIFNGGLVSNVEGRIGNNADGVGTATVDGTGSTWTNTSDLSIGSFGDGTLDISNGGSVSSALGYIGTEDDSMGTVNVVGPDSTWTSTSLLVGNSGNGTLNISAGGAVFSDAARISDNTNSTGTVQIDGPGSSWTSTSTLTIGGDDTAAGGTGTLTLTNEGKVSVTDTLKVWNTGTMTLNGGTLEAGTLVVEELGDEATTGDFIWTGGTVRLTNSSLQIGDLIGPFGNELTIDSSETLEVTNGSVLVGRSSMGTGNLTVNGTGVLNVSQQLSVALVDSLASNLYVQDGGTVTTGLDVVLGATDQSGVSGDAYVQGPGSTLNIGDDLLVFNNADLFANMGGQIFIGDDCYLQSGADMYVNGDAQVHVTDGLLIGSGADVYIGSATTGGTLSYGFTSIGSSGNLNFTRGTLNDTNGVTMTATDRLDDARNLTANKTFDVDGLTTLNGVTMQLAGGTFETDALDISTGTLLWTAGTLNHTGGTSNVSLAVPALGNLNASGAINGTVTSAPASTIAATGSLDITNVLAGGVFDVGMNTVSVSGLAQFPLGSTLSVPSGGTFAATNGVTLNGSMSVAGTVTGRIIASQSSVINVQGNVALGDATNSSGFFSNGAVNINDHTVVLNDSNDVVFDSGASVALGGNGTGTLSAANGLTLDFGGNISGYGTINTPDSAATPLINNGHIAGNSLAEPITLSGYVKGVGTLDNVVITGTDAPGFSPATVVRGSVVYDGTLEIELGGTLSGDFDQINHVLGTGIADLGGTLDVSLLGGFSPSVGDTFKIVTALGGLSGTFATESLPNLGPLLVFNAIYDANALTLAVVPSLTGDYNADGIVNAADYTTWRDTLGQTGIGLAADGDASGTVDAADYTFWKTNFGMTTPAALAASTSANGAVPEPATIHIAWILIVAGLVHTFRRG